MSASSAAARLKDVEKRLRQQWSAVRAVWEDEQALRFEEEIVGPLLDQLRSAGRAMGQLDVTLQQVRRECA